MRRSTREVTRAVPEVPGGGRIAGHALEFRRDPLQLFQRVREIAARTGLPQSYVSEVVARLRDLGTLETRADPSDRRRTLVKVSDSVPPAVAGLGATPVDELLTEALGQAPADRAAELIAALSEVAVRLRARLGGPGTPEARLRAAGNHGC